MKLIQLICFAKVICDAYTPQGEPIPTNKRHRAAEIFSNPKVEAEIPWYISYPCLYNNKPNFVMINCIIQEFII